MATESELRQHRACFTGHRPHKLHQPKAVVIAALEDKIREAVNNGFVTFISGMAWGVDIWAAEIVLRLKREGYPLHLIAAVPYEGFEKGWDAAFSLIISTAGDILDIDAAAIITAIDPRPEAE